MNQARLFIRWCFRGDTISTVNPMMDGSRLSAICVTPESCAKANELIANGRWMVSHCSRCDKDIKECRCYYQSYRFIGGSRDGETYTVENGRDRVRMTVVNHGNPNVADPGRRDKYEYEEYRSFRIRGEQEEFVVFAHSGLSSDEIMRLLIAGYKGC